ncbi:MAG: MerR family transcriptional regulator [Bacteroidota bacterium]
MINTAQNTKLYYTITEVAVMLKVNPSLLRFWEKEFDMISPKKNKKGTRHYTKKDIELIDTIYSLVKDKGFTLEGAKKFIKSKEVFPVDNSVPQTSTIPNQDIIKRLEEIKIKLIGLENSI